MHPNAHAISLFIHRNIHRVGSYLQKVHIIAYDSNLVVTVMQIMERHFKVGTDASFSATVRVSSVLRKSTCERGLGEVAIWGGGGTSLGGRIQDWGGGARAHPKVYKSTPLTETLLTLKFSHSSGVLMY